MSEAPFTLDPNGQVAGVSSEVLRRCFGKQSPITPHAQRLLVAASKEAGVPKPAAPKTKAKAKAKPKAAPKGKTGKEKASQEKSKGGKEKATKAKSREKTPYALAKDAFMAEFLGAPPKLNNNH